MKDLNKPKAEIIDTQHTDMHLDTSQVNDEVMADICKFVSNGGSETRWALLHNLNYGVFKQAMRINPIYVKMLSEARRDREEWLKEEILQLLKQMMSFDPRKAFDSNGNYLGMNDMPEEIALMIKKSKTVRVIHKDGSADDIDELVFFDKQKAIDQLGKHLNMFIERQEIHHKLTLEETIQRSREKN